MAREQLSPYNVVATYCDMPAARKAFDALERAGVDGDDISLLGPHADAAAAEAETRERDAHLVGDVGQKAMKGGAIGSIPGAVAGTVPFAIPAPAPPIRPGLSLAPLASP